MGPQYTSCLFPVFFVSSDAHILVLWWSYSISSSCSLLEDRYSSRFVSFFLTGIVVLNSIIFPSKDVMLIWPTYETPSHFNKRIYFKFLNTLKYMVLCILFVMSRNVLWNHNTFINIIFKKQITPVWTIVMLEMVKLMRMGHEIKYDFVELTHNTLIYNTDM